VERKFFNQSQPQTLQGAVFLLYANVVFALLFRTGGESVFALAAYSIGRGHLSPLAATRVGNITAVAVVLASAAAAYLIANEKKIGWRIGVAVAALPIAALVILIVAGYPARTNILDAVSVKLIFDVALLVLLVHDQSRSYEKVWFK
jgi:hypothetical protein